MTIKANMTAIIVMLMGVIALAIGITVARAFIVDGGNVVSATSVTGSSGAGDVVYQW